MENAYGQYEGNFNDTNQSGVYPVSVVVSASTPAGALVTRYRYFTGLIFRPGGNGGDPNGGGSEIDHDCREARIVQKRLEELLLRLAEKHPEERQEIVLLLGWLKEFITNCCKHSKPDEAKKLRALIEKARQLLLENET